MISAPAAFTALLLATSTVNAIPIWSRLVARNANTPVQVAQGSNFFFDSLHLEDACTPGQIACISSNLAKCSPEANWEMSPCTGNTTCLAVPSSDSGVLVQCMKFTDAQSALGTDQVSVDFQVTQPPMNTATAIASSSATPTESASATETASASTTQEFTATLGTPVPSATDAPAPTETPSPTESADPSATCTDDTEGPEFTEYQTITLVLIPNPTQSGVFETSTLTGDGTEPTSTESASATPTDGSSSVEPTPTESATQTDEPAPTESATGTAEPPATCTEEPAETSTELNGEPAPTESSTESGTEPALAPTESATDAISSVTGSAPTTEAAPSASATESPSSTGSATSTQETGLTLTIAPNFTLSGAVPTQTTPSNAGANPPSAGVTPEVSVVGTHYVPASAPSTPAKMIRRRR